MTIDVSTEGSFSKAELGRERKCKCGKHSHCLGNLGKGYVGILCIILASFL